MAVMKTEEEYANALALAATNERARITKYINDRRDAALGRGEFAVADELTIIGGVLDVAVTPPQGWVDTTTPAPATTSDDEDAEIAVQQLRHAPHPVLGVPRD